MVFSTFFICTCYYYRNVVIVRQFFFLIFNTHNFQNSCVSVFEFKQKLDNQLESRTYRIDHCYSSDGVLLFNQPKLKPTSIAFKFRYYILFVQKHAQLISLSLSLVFAKVKFPPDNIVFHNSRRVMV